MDPTQEINEGVEIVCIYRRTMRRGKLVLLTEPWKMVWRGQEIKFIEVADRYPTKQGKRMIHMYYMWDGTNGYAIEFDAEQLSWTLKKIISGEDHA